MFNIRLTALYVTFLSLTFCLPGVLNSQTKQPYVIQWSVLNEGGNTEEATSANYRLKDAIGQLVTGKCESANYKVWIGFWGAKTVQVGVEEMQEARGTMQETKLFQNYPNPFVERTSIQYAVASRQRRDKNLTTDYCLLTTLKIFDLSGSLVRTLVDQSQEPGYYKVSWDSKDDYGKEVPSGVYFYRLIAHTGLGTADYSSTKKLILLK